MSAAAALRWVKKSSTWTSRALGWSVVTVILACALVVLSLRYWVLPKIESYREDIAAAVSRAANVRITIGKIAADWDGIRPQLKLENVAIFDKTGRRALELSRVESTIAWRSLAMMQLHFHALDIYHPVLVVRRDANGVFSIAGIEQKDEAERGGFIEWLLQQPDVEVHDAVMSWTDELRKAPPLQLEGVKLQIVNRGERHRFGLRATPPAELAAPIDVRGDLRGRSVDRLMDWTGRFFLQLDYADVPAWKPWIDIPVPITSGAGAVRTWLKFSHHELTEAVADVRLGEVKTQLRKDLPELELHALEGRLGWKALPKGFEFSTVRLGLTAGSATLPPADFMLRIAEDGQGIEQAELRANALALLPLVTLADRLPLGEELRKDLVTLSPRGNVQDVVMRWTGTWPNLVQYSVRGRFEALALNRWEKLPGVSGLSGSIDGTDKGGTLQVSGQKAGLDLPLVFGAELELDTLDAQAGWTRAPDHVEVRLTKVSFANPDVAGTVSGSYRSAPAGAGEVDLTGALTRAEARALPRYIPITVLRKARPWLERALVAGQSNDVRFRVKGKLEDFPFPKDHGGVFHVTAKITGGALDYAERWPRVEDMEGDLQFRGSHMDFLARQATITGVRLTNVQGDIPDLKAVPEVLSLSGEAAGATADFLAFVARSPVIDMIDRFTDGVQAQGNGRLALTLTLPLGEPSGNRLAGSFEFINNNLTFERDLPPLEQANGRIEFTEGAVRVAGVSGIFLGGPVTITGATQKDASVRLALQGRVNADNVRNLAGVAWMQHLRGSAEWRGALTLRKKVPDLVIESNLQGVASALPAPFGKAATDSVALRIERRYVNAQQDRVSVSYGDIVRAELARKTDGKQTLIERAAVLLGGGEAGEPDRPGIWVRGTMKSLDLDQWLDFSGREGGTAYALAGADVKLGDVNIFGRHFQDVALTAAAQGDAMQLTLAAPAIEGAATWRGEGRGRLVARLKKFTLPPGDPKTAAAVAQRAAMKPPELPALDVVVEQFQLGQKQLGRLELNAVPQDRDWRIERLRIANPDSVLNAEGMWQGWLTQPRTHVKVQVDVSDVGNALPRWGLPPGVRRGTAKIEGQLSWNGSPQDFDAPTLSGQLAVEAANGQFVKIDPGVAKLLGILSLQALPRRITLDFRDVFSDGFVFDSITGTVKIDRGMASTENFRIEGPSARVVMSGVVDLARETQKLHVRVTPHISESVSGAAALLGGPVAGVAAYLAQKILRDPIERIASFEYDVTGGWADPQVNKTARPAPAMSESSP